MSSKPAILGEPAPGATASLGDALSCIAGTVQETMLITLWARAMEARRPDAIVRDAHAVRIAAAMPYDFDRFEGGWKSQVGVAVRTRCLDELARAFLARHPGAWVVNIGAGLDSRFERVDDGTVHWIDLDLPGVIALRRSFFVESPRNRFVSGCALETTWGALIPRGVPVLVIAEGVLMFMGLARVRCLLDELATALPGGEIAFDCIGGLMVRVPRLHDTLPATDARFRWGLRSTQELSTWSTRAEVLDVAPMLVQSPRRWRWMRWLRFVPPMRRQFVVAHMRFDGQRGHAS